MFVKIIIELFVLEHAYIYWFIPLFSQLYQEKSGGQQLRMASTVFNFLCVIISYNNKYIYNRP